MKKNLMIESVMFITGRRQNLKLNGPKSEVQAYLNVLLASKKLYEALEDPTVRLSEIDQLVEKKNKLAKTFLEKTGTTWPM